MDIRSIQKVLTILLMFLSIGVGFSQENKIKKADKDFDRYAYIDARDIYLKVVEDGYASAEIYKKLGDTYYWNSDYVNASQWYLRLVDQFPAQTDAAYYLRAAQSLKTVGDYEKSDEMMEQYVALTGDNLIIQNYEENKDYLSKIAFISKKYELIKTDVSSGTSDFGSAYYNGNIVFASAEGTTGGGKSDWTDQPYLDLFVAIRDSLGKLSDKERLSNKINTKYHESSAVFTKDGSAIFFTRNNYIQGKRKAGKDKERTVRLKLYKSSKDANGNWTDALEMPFNSDDYSTAHPALSNDEKRLYFSSDMPGTNGMSDLWYVDILGSDAYGVPVNLGEIVNTEARESFPFISRNGNIYFSTDGRPGLGGYDIFSAPIDEDGIIGEIVNIGVPANSNQDDFGLIIEEDLNLGYVSSNRDGEQGSSDDDIYRIQFASCRVDIAGVVIDKNTSEVIPRATVRLLNKDNEQIDELIANDMGEFSFPEMDCERQYTVRASKVGYEPNEELITTPNESVKLHLVIPLTPVDPCPPNDLGCRLTLQPIYFDFDKSFIRPDAAIELAKILAAMRQYPALIIHIESHTDSRGEDIYNEKLSGRRAQSTKKWLIENGIDASRLTARGYGEYQLTNNQCSNGVKCSEEEHQLNRRSMFIIQN
ncbi:MAG: outer membrane protein OmpA-like peptidoglycan-associated protein [Patiriisocius sp.]|jgi:outer membrane protein OmpA-like peptidoglycan-associated protein/tetratricopeptide (TPR) repeat protein